MKKEEKSLKKKEEWKRKSWRQSGVAEIAGQRLVHQLANQDPKIFLKRRTSLATQN